MKRRKHELTLWGLSCSECGAYLVPTPGGFLACPAGHGRLHVEEPAEGSAGGLFDTDIESEAPGT